MGDTTESEERRTPLQSIKNTIAGLPREALHRFRRSSREFAPWFFLGVSLTHITATSLTIGFRLDHLAANVCGLTPIWWGGRARRLVMMWLPLMMTGASYEFSRFLMVYQGTVHIEDIYMLERLLFGVTVAGERMVWPEYFELYNWAVLDAVCGLTYGYYVYHCIGMGIIVSFFDGDLQQRMAWSWFIANSLGIIIYIAFPVAPPWYVSKYGFEYIASAPSSAAGALRFDALFNTTFFADLYKLANTPFGAMPSLHFGGPLAIAIGALGAKRWFVTFLFVVPAMIGFSSVYLQHHYILDLLGGAVVAIIAALFVRWCQRTIPRTHPVFAFFNSEEPAPATSTTQASS